MLKTVIVGYNICLTQVRFEPFVKHLLKIAQLGMNCGRWTKPNLSACVDKLGFFPDSRGKGGEEVCKHGCFTTMLADLCPPLEVFS